MAALAALAAFSAAWCCAAGLPSLPGQWLECLLPALLCAVWAGCSVAKGLLNKRTLLAVVLLALLVGWRALPPAEPPPKGAPWEKGGRLTQSQA